MGRNYIPKKYAGEINEFYETYFNEYLNFHRPCGFPTVTTDEKGKQKKIYEQKNYMTPYEKLRSLQNPQQYLKPDVSLKCLDMSATNESDNESAAAMQKARVELFTKIHRKS